MENLFGVVDKTNDQKNIDTEKDVLISTVETIKNNLRSCELMFAVGFESRPAKNDKLIIIPIGNSKRNLVAIAGKNEVLDPLKNDGERRLTSTNEAGNQIVVKIHLKNDGILEINANTEIIFQGGTDFAVRYSALETAFNQLKTELENHVHTAASVGFSLLDSSAGPCTGSVGKPIGSSIADITPAKINDIKVP